MAQINSWPEWECVRKIGEGSFARVYEIQRIEEGKIYKAALKVITIPQNQVDIDDVYSEGMSIEEVDKYFGSLVKDITNEISLMSDLKGYTNIVSYEDHKVIKHSDDIGWDILIRMELLTPLQEWIKNHSMDEKTVIKLGCDISEALKLCHKNKIIHRDIKPENIFVNKNGDFKLGDFGIAKVTEKTISVMSQKGTYSYMAPEVYKGEEYNETVDIYSLGIVLYRFMNQGRLPFLPFSELKYSDRAIAFEKRMSGEPISEPMNGSQELKKVIMKSIQYKAGMRYKNASEFFDALEKCKKYNENFNLENDITITMDDATVNKDKTIDNGEVRERTLKIKLKWLILVIIVAMGIIFAIVFENKGEEELPTTAPKNDELQQTSELVSDEEAVSEKITVKPEWLKYREMTYEKFKNQTGVIAKHESDNYYVATLSNNEIRVIFHAVLGLEDSTSCYRLEGKIDSLLNGIGDTMTINELVSALAWENGIEPTYDVEATADYKTMYGQYFGVAFAKISFDSDGDGNIDADLHVSLDESGNVNTFSNAWLSLDVIVENVIGMEKDDAVACLERQGFIVDCIEEYSSAENQGKVTAIAHGPGAPLKFGTRINVYVGKGVEEVSIADRYIPLFQYEGYLDECEEWANNDIFSQKDYDADGIVDKI